MGGGTLLAEGGLRISSDQAASPQATRESWLPTLCMDIPLLSILLQHAHSGEEEEEQAVGRKCGQGSPLGREETDACSWLLAPT